MVGNRIWLCRLCYAAATISFNSNRDLDFPGFSSLVTYRLDRIERGCLDRTSRDLSASEVFRKKRRFNRYWSKLVLELLILEPSGPKRAIVGLRQKDSR